MQPENPQDVTPTPFSVCTRVCTSESENANAGTLETVSLDTLPQAADTIDTDQGNEDEGIDQGDPLTKLAVAIASLSPTDRQRLAAMLTGHQDEGEATAQGLCYGSFPGIIQDDG